MKSRTKKVLSVISVLAEAGIANEVKDLTVFVSEAKFEEAKKLISEQGITGDDDLIKTDKEIDVEHQDEGEVTVDDGDANLDGSNDVASTINKEISTAKSATDEDGVDKVVAEDKDKEEDEKDVDSEEVEEVEMEESEDKDKADSEEEESDDDLSDEIKEHMKAIGMDDVGIESIQEAFKTKIQETRKSLKKEIAEAKKAAQEKADSDVQSAILEWSQENTELLQKGTKGILFESLVKDMKSLFSQYGTDLVEESNVISELQESLDKANDEKAQLIEENKEKNNLLIKALKEAFATEIAEENSLSVLQKKKLLEQAENTKFVTESGFKGTLKKFVKENLKRKSTKKPRNLRMERKDEKELPLDPKVANIYKHLVSKKSDS